MIIENQLVEVKWHSRNYNWYISKGYKYTFMGEKFYVKVEDLMPRSKSYVLIKCDYCGAITKIKWQSYQNRCSPNLKDTCTRCKTRKAEDSNLEKYGVKNVFELNSTKEKIKDYYRLNYGVEYYSQTQMYRENHILEKIVESMYKNGTGPTSLPQNETFLLLYNNFDECYLNYPCGKLLLDCVIFLDGIKIDIEYDGTYWHKNKSKDYARDYYVKSQGYKILRISSRRRSPTKKELFEAIYKLSSSHHSFYKIDLDV